MISIIVPVYNVQEYIEHCLNSIGSQTCKGRIECILVDDCGNDDSVVIADRFISSYTGDVKFKIIKHKKNRGLSSARNTGFLASKGRFITFIDSDDWIEPLMCEELAGLLEKDPKALFVSSSITAEFPDSQKYHYANTDKYIEGGIIEPKDFLKQILLTQTNNSACNKLFRREFIKQLFRDGKVCEDFLFFYDNCKTWLNSEYHYLTTTKAYYHYIIHSGSITNQDSQSSKQWYLDFLLAMIYVLDDCKADYPDLYILQLNHFGVLYGHYFYKIVNNKNITNQRADELKTLNRYVHRIPKQKLSFMTRLDIYCASYIPNGYCIVRSVVKFRNLFKSYIEKITN